MKLMDEDTPLTPSQQWIRDQVYLRMAVDQRDWASFDAILANCTDVSRRMNEAIIGEACAAKIDTAYDKAVAAPTPKETP